MPIVQLIQCKDVEITDSTAPSGENAFFGVDGGDSSGIVLAAGNLRNARKAVETSGKVSPDAVTIVRSASAPEPN